LQYIYVESNKAILIINIYKSHAIKIKQKGKKMKGITFHVETEEIERKEALPGKPTNKSLWKKGLEAAEKEVQRKLKKSNICD
jgi:hypothetical protein